MTEKPKLAVIGGGIAGLSSAWLLARKYTVTLFEADKRLGGHTNTVDVTLDGCTAPVDTGFLVFNDRTYPNLMALFKHLEVQSVASDMSFSVSLADPDLEWAGTSLATLFGQRRNVLRPAFWRMASDILRFNLAASSWTEAATPSTLTLGEHLRSGGYSNAFSDWYLLPMAAAIWSCPPQQMLAMPANTFLRFCLNHGLLQINNRPQWRSVLGGGHRYIEKLARTIPVIHRDCPIRMVERQGRKLTLHHAGGQDSFDQIVVACHSDQALNLLDDAISVRQRILLSAIRYHPNEAVIHTDISLLPRRKRLWSAWNYVSDSDATGNAAVCVSYLINRLQRLPFQTPIVVTLNPVRQPDPAKTIARMSYCHPVFDHAAINAQSQLDCHQGDGGIWFAGAWTGYGFHEDGLKSAITVANKLGVTAPWQRQSGDSLDAANRSAA